MSDLAELERRISAALDRIGQGVEVLSAAAPDPEQEGRVAELEAALEEERLANAQLEERVKAIKERQDTTVETLNEEVSRLRDLLAEEEIAVGRLREMNGALRDNNEALRAAISAGVAEPHLVNKSMMAELEALRAAQTADRAELDAVLGELGPLVTAMEAGAAEQAREKAAQDVATDAMTDARGVEAADA